MIPAPVGIYARKDGTQEEEIIRLYVARFWHAALKLELNNSIISHHTTIVLSGFIIVSLASFSN